MFKEIPLSHNVVILSIGSNLGNKLMNIESAYQQITEKFKLSKIYSSPVIETSPWGYQSENTFYNCAVAFESNINDPKELLNTIQHIEKEIGRAKKSIDGIYADRLIDIDIIFFGKVMLQEKDLQIPHPKMEVRSFVLNPIALIDAPFLADNFKAFVQTLIANCPDKSEFRLMNEE